MAEAMTKDKPRRKLIACVSTEQFRRLVAERKLRASSWTPEYRKPGNTVPIVYGSATVAVFSASDAIFLCASA